MKNTVSLLTQTLRNETEKKDCSCKYRSQKFCNKQNLKIEDVFSHVCIWWTSSEETGIPQQKKLRLCIKNAFSNRMEENLKTQKHD